MKILSDTRKRHSGATSSYRKQRHQNHHPFRISSRCIIVFVLCLVVFMMTWISIQVGVLTTTTTTTTTQQQQSDNKIGGGTANNHRLTTTSSSQQLVETPPFNSKFQQNQRQQPQHQTTPTTTKQDIIKKFTTPTSTTFGHGSLTFDTLSWTPHYPPIYKPTKGYDNNDDGATKIPPIDGLVYERPPDLMLLPKWIRDYVVWHATIRQQYPDMELFTNPTAPPLLIRTCLGLCGGLHDRIGQLPWDLYLAAKTKRVLLIAWQRPKELEYFLQPSLLSKSTISTNGDTATTKYDGIALDWTVPRAAKFGFDDFKLVRSTVTELFGNSTDSKPSIEFFEQEFDKAIERATIGSYSKIKILRHRLLGHLHQEILEELLQKEGWYNNLEDQRYGYKPSDIHRSPTFGRIFHLFFRPSNPVHELIANTMAQLGLLGSTTTTTSTTSTSSSSFHVVLPFNAVHCRVRHPKAHAKGEVVKGKFEKYPADKTGLPWEPNSTTRRFAIDTAQTALQCAHDVILAKQDDTGGSSSGGGVTNHNNNDNQNHGRIYFLADSNDLVRYVATELQDSTFLSVNASLVSSSLLHTIHDLNKIGSTPVARNVEMETAHIDRQKGRDPTAYYATLVDLYIAMHAQCVVYGIGYYAAFAAKISGTTCQYLYAVEEWGAQTDKRRANNNGGGGGGEGNTNDGGGGSDSGGFGVAHLCPNVVESIEES